MDHDAILDVYNFLLLLLIPCSLFPLLEPHCLGWFSCGCSLNLYSKRGILPLVGGHTFPFSFLLGTGTLTESLVTWTISPWWSYQFPTPLQKSCSLLFLLVPLHDESKETQWNFKASFFLFLVAYLLIDFREKASEWERKGEKHWCERETVSCCLLYMPTGDQTHQPGMCPDQELNQHSLTLQHDAPPTKSYSLIAFFMCSDRGLILQLWHIRMTL